MGLNIEPAMVLFFALGLVLLYIAGWFLLVPGRVLLKFTFNSIIGALALILLNLIGGVFAVTIPVNPVNAIVVGLFGLPGVALLLVIQLIFL